MRATRSLAIILGLFVGIEGCTEFPTFDASISAEAEAAAYPDLVPIDPLMSSLEMDQLDAPATEAALRARVAALRGRAERLRSTEAVTGAERQRLESGLR